MDLSLSLFFLLLLFISPQCLALPKANKANKAMKENKAMKITKSIKTTSFDIGKNYVDEMLRYGPSMVVDYKVKNRNYQNLALKIWVNVNQNRKNPEEHTITVVRLDNLTEHPNENVNFKMQQTDLLWRDVKGWKENIELTLNDKFTITIPQNPLTDSVKIVQKFPENTFERENSAEKKEIPKNIFMISSNQKGKAMRVIEKVILLNGIKNPSYKMHHISQEEMPIFVEQFAGTNARRTLEAIKPMAYKADFYRLLVLFHFGGIYLDSKITSLLPLSSFLPKEGSFLVKGIVNSRIQNTVMATPPASLYIGRLLEEITRNVRTRFYGKDPYSPTGPSLLAKVYQEMTADEKSSYHFMANCGFDFIKTGRKLLFTFHNAEYRRRQSLDTKTTSYWLDWDRRNIYN